MKAWSQIIVILVIGLIPVLAGADGGEPVPIAEGLAVINPVHERSCIALRVDVPAGKALSGIQWFNGATEYAFPRLLVASGSDDLPPVYDSAVVLAEQVTGLENAWSEVEFSEPVASLSGTLFVILQFPAFYVPPEDGVSMGVGYREFDGENSYYISRDGDKWYRLSSNYDFLLNPVYVDRGSNVIALSAPGAEVVDLESETTELPTKTSFRVYPNPFNPEIQLKLELKQAAQCELKIYDLKGRLVRSLQSGNLPAGTTVLRWSGRDDGGLCLPFYPSEKNASDSRGQPVDLSTVRN
jgi:hypothetical protein